MVHANSHPPKHVAGDLCLLFDQCFADEFSTRLLAGGEEPVYLPADQAHSCHRIIFRQDYFASALHEIAHWCVAGNERRRMVDYGYWYAPDGRDLQQQKAFEQVEVNPQALEWVLCQAAAYPFRPSADNLELAAGPSKEFCSALVQRAQYLCCAGLNPRAERMANALRRHYHGSNFYNPALYQLKYLYTQ